MQFIDLQTQYQAYQAGVMARLEAVLEHGRYIMGPEISELETELAEYVGVRHAITVASGTAALEMALRALDIGPGDEVVTVPFTWISTAEAVALVGATPVFVDIEADGFNIDIERIEEALTPRTRAILPVSLFGLMPDYERINTLAARYGLTVIEDGAQSFGAMRHGRRSGGATKIGCTSFFPEKTFGCYGDGGALFTDDDEVADALRAIRTHGALTRFHHVRVGMNGRLDTLQAAVLLAKLPHFEDEVEQRRRIGARYNERLEGVCAVPRCPPDAVHVYGQYTVRAPQRDRVRRELVERGIPAAVYYPKALHQQPVFAGGRDRAGEFPEAERAAREVISLPMHPFLTDKDQDFIVETLKRLLESHAAA